MHYFLLLLVVIPTLNHAMEEGFKKLTLTDNEKNKNILVIVNKTSKPIKQQTNVTAKQKREDKGGLKLSVNSILGSEQYEVVPTNIQAQIKNDKKHFHAKASIWHEPITLLASAIQVPEFQNNLDKKLSLQVDAATEFELKEPGFHGIYEDNGKLVLKKLESCKPQAIYKEQFVIKNESKETGWYRIAALYEPKNKIENKDEPAGFLENNELFITPGKTFNLPKIMNTTYTNNDDGRQFSRKELLSKVIVLRRFISDANEHSQKNSEPYHLTASTVSNQSYEFDNSKNMLK